MFRWLNISVLAVLLTIPGFSFGGSAADVQRRLVIGTKVALGPSSKMPVASAADGGLGR